MIVVAALAPVGAITVVVAAALLELELALSPIATYATPPPTTTISPATAAHPSHAGTPPLLFRRPTTVDTSTCRTAFAAPATPLDTGSFGPLSAPAPALFFLA